MVMMTTTMTSRKWNFLSIHLKTILKMTMMKVISLPMVMATVMMKWNQMVYHLILHQNLEPIHLRLSLRLTKHFRTILKNLLIQRLIIFTMIYTLQHRMTFLFLTRKSSTRLKLVLIGSKLLSMQRTQKNFMKTS